MEKEKSLQGPPHARARTRTNTHTHTHTHSTRTHDLRTKPSPIAASKMPNHCAGECVVPSTTLASTATNTTPDDEILHDDDVIISQLRTVISMNDVACYRFERTPKERCGPCYGGGVAHPLASSIYQNAGGIVFCTFEPSTPGSACRVRWL